MSAQDNITFGYESSSALMGHTTEWHVTYKGRPFYVVMHELHGDRLIRIDALDTQRAIKPTSRRGQAIVEMMLSAHAEKFTVEEPEDDPEDPEVFHIQHSRSGQGVSTLCGEFIPWRTPTGQERAITGRRATRGNQPCPSCMYIRSLRQELQAADMGPLVVPALLDEVDQLLNPHQ